MGPESLFGHLSIQTTERYLGTEQNLGGQGKAGGVTRYPNAFEKYDFWPDQIRALALPATTAESNEFRRAQAVVNVFQPFRYAPMMLGLLGIGAVGAKRPSAEANSAGAYLGVTMPIRRPSPARGSSAERGSGRSRR